MNRSSFPMWAVGAVAVAVALAVAGAPLSALLPFAVLLACPLMMVFMMRGAHGGGACGHAEHEADDRTHDATRS